MQVVVKFIQLIIIYTFCLISSQGFLHKLPTNLHPQIIKITKLDNLISSKAIIASIVNDMRSEINLEKMFFDMRDANYLNYCLYLTIFSSFIFSQIQYFNNVDKNEKYMKISKYKKTRMLTEKVVFVILFVLFRDIDNAT